MPKYGFSVARIFPHEKKTELNILTYTGKDVLEKTFNATNFV